ncbi:MAG: 4-hydroxythreonine-4-phosphate dehydrogenase PdxA, partial [Pyrinomonadaceae bacterium]
MNELKPIIGITVGDPAGIGPEIVIKAVSDPAINDLCRPVLIGDRKDLEWTSDELRLGATFIQFDDEAASNGSITVIDQANLEHSVEFGIESASTGRSAATNIEAAVDLWKAGTIDAIATAPISKNALKLAGYLYPGHTEFLAALTGTKEFAMSFFAEKLRVVLLSTHVSLRNA